MESGTKLYVITSTAGITEERLPASSFLKTWGEDTTEANLDNALPYIRPHLKFKSDALVKLENAANGMALQEAEIFDAWMSRQRLESPDSDQGKENATNILIWLREKNLEIIGRNLDLALQNIINNGHLGHAPLVWKPVKAKKQEHEMSDAEIATWRSRAEGARVETPSGLFLQGKTADPKDRCERGRQDRLESDCASQRKSRSTDDGQGVTIGWGGTVLLTAYLPNRFLSDEFRHNTAPLGIGVCRIPARLGFKEPESLWCRARFEDAWGETHE
jgi:hypothetical protein